MTEPSGGTNATVVGWGREVGLREDRRQKCLNRGARHTAGGARDHPVRMLQSGGQEARRVRSACTSPPFPKYCTAIQDPHADGSMHQEQDNRKQKNSRRENSGKKKMVVVFCESPAVGFMFGQLLVV